MSAARDTERLQRVLTDSAPALRDAVINGFAFEPKDLARVATPEVLDQLITNGLALRLGDASFAHEIYDDLRHQAIDMPERLHDARISIRLSMDRSTTFGRAPAFVATIRWEFSVTPTYATRRFICLSDLEEYRDLAQDTTATSAWYIGKRSGLDAGTKETFELVEFTVDGKPRPIRRSAKQGSQTYSVSLGQEAMQSNKPLAVSYTYRTLVALDDHVLRLRVDQPTRGLAAELDYGDTNITNISVLDYITSSERARISRSPATVPGKTVTLEFDGWVMPRSGVAFVWSDVTAKR